MTQPHTWCIGSIIPRVASLYQKRKTSFAELQKATTTSLQLWSSRQFLLYSTDIGRHVQGETGGTRNPSHQSVLHLLKNRGALTVGFVYLFVRNGSRIMGEGYYRVVGLSLSFVPEVVVVEADCLPSLGDPKCD